MSDFVHSFEQILHKLGGREAVQILLGVGPSAVKLYEAHRNSP